MPGLGAGQAPHARRRLRTLGFQGPFSGGKHDFMTRGNIVVSIPNPHRGDIGIGLLKLILEQAGVRRKEWEDIR